MRPLNKATLLTLALVATTAISSGLIGCSASAGPLAQYQPNSQELKTVDGRIAGVPPDQRGEPVPVIGVSEFGDTVLSDDLVDQIYVVKIWYLACGPCIVSSTDA